ncbi:MAG TPA: hypothetical protein VG407_02430 [Caulobacteraceae bacterium]|jgi:hypothetical protein|nr:hypothetical protein [Caulobacteraceae bacterium]
MTVTTLRFASGLWLVSGAAMLSLAGCGKAAPSQPGIRSKAEATAAPNACGVLTETVAKKYLGAAAVLKQDAHPNPRVSLCQYASDRGAISVLSGPWEMVDSKTGQDTPVAGLGDEAHLGPIGLFVRKGDHGLSIDVITASGEFWGKAADDVTARNHAAEQKVAPDLIAND